MRRREFFGAVTAPLIVSRTSGQQPPAPPTRKGRIKQGVTRGVFGRGATLEDSCRDAARLGIKGFDLIGPADWPTLKKNGLVPSMYPGPGGTIADALNRKENHVKLRTLLDAAIDEAAANGVPNIITFSGNRNGMADAEGAENCVAFLDAIKAHAEDKQITICIEYLNSKVNHKDADIVRNIRDHFQWIGHFHTGGNPGRHEIDETQELNYRFVMQAIADLGFTGFVSHEYSPSQGHDPIKELEKAIALCDV